MLPIICFMVRERGIEISLLLLEAFGCHIGVFIVLEVIPGELMSIKEVL